MRLFVLAALMVVPADTQDRAGGLPLIEKLRAAAPA